MLECMQELFPEFYDMYVDKKINHDKKIDKIREEIKTPKLREVIKEESAKAQEEDRHIDYDGYDMLDVVSTCVSDDPVLIYGGGYRTIYQSDSVAYVGVDIGVYDKIVKYKEHIYKLIKTKDGLRIRIDGILCGSVNGHNYPHANLNYQPPPTNPTN